MTQDQLREILKRVEEVEYYVNFTRDKFLERMLEVFNNHGSLRPTFMIGLRALDKKMGNFEEFEMPFDFSDTTYNNVRKSMQAQGSPPVMYTWAAALEATDKLGTKQLVLVFMGQDALGVTFRRVYTVLGPAPYTVLHSDELSRTMKLPWEILRFANIISQINARDVLN